MWVKENPKSSPCMPWKQWGGRGGGMAPFILKLGGEWSGFRPGHFTPGEKDSSIHSSEGWVGPTIALAVLPANRRFLDRPAYRQVTKL